MNTIEQFRHFMLAGHGRAFSILKGNEKLLKETVLFGCLNDISFDMQCEGSRGFFMYDLALQYEDHAYFLRRATAQLLREENNTDWHAISHLFDFIEAFAEDGNIAAQKTISEKYEQLYAQLMSVRMSRKAMQILECYEYAAICMLQHDDTEQTVKVCRDIGAYFLRRKKTDAQELLWLFHSFRHHLEDTSGSEHLMEQLEEAAKSSKELQRFLRIMQTEEEKPERPPQPKPRADEFIQLAEEESPEKRKFLRLRLSEESEKHKLAEAVLSEPDPVKKAHMLYSFQIRRNAFPLSPEPLVEYARSTHEALRNAATEALCYVQAECVHAFALELLKESFSEAALEMLLNNFRKEDEALLLRRLSMIGIDPENKSGWHDLVLTILNAEPREALPDNLFWFVYEKSLCSCCRESAFRELQKRKLLTEAILSEARRDCNEDIRAAAEKGESHADKTQRKP